MKGNETERRGARFRARQKELGMTNTEMARFLDVHVNSIGNWRRGEKPPRAVLICMHLLKLVQDHHRKAFEWNDATSTSK